MIEVRRADDRGQADLGWLQSKHSFSFADYQDPEHVNFGPLRVINEDWIAPGTGFGTHGHRDMEIITYVLSGAITHRDSMGNQSEIRPGNVQRMSAGTGVRHSEHNLGRDKTHMLQIWIHPDRVGIEPGYEERVFDDHAKRGRLVLIASPQAVEGSVKIHQDARVYAGLFTGQESAQLAISPGRRVYAHLARGTLTINGVRLHAGDAAKLVEENTLAVSNGEAAEVIVFDLP